MLSVRNALRASVLFASLFIFGSAFDDPFCMEVGWRLKGDEYRTIQEISDPRDCQQECEFDDRCFFWRFRGTPRTCELLDVTNGEWEFSISNVCGPKTCYVPPSDFPETSNSACKVVGLKIEGDHYDSVKNGKDNTACQMLCNRDSRCAYWRWSAPNSLEEEDQRCFLFDSASAISGYDTDIRHVSGPKKCPSSELPERFPIWRSKKKGDPSRELPWPKAPLNGRRHLPHCVEWQKQISETVGAAYKVADWRDCRALCAVLPACRGWNWHAAGALAERCELFPFSRTEAPLHTESSLLTVTGPKTCEDPLFDFPEYSQVACAKWGAKTKGTVLSSETVQPSAVPEDCMILCQYTAGCVAYTFSLADRQCALLSSDEGSEDQLGSLSGPAVCLDRPSHHTVHIDITRREGWASTVQALPLVPVVPKVPSVSVLEAASVPVATSTAARAEQEEAEKRGGETVVHDCEIGVSCEGTVTDEPTDSELGLEESADETEKNTETMEEVEAQSPSPPSSPSPSTSMNKTATPDADEESAVPDAQTVTSDTETETEIEKSESDTDEADAAVPVSPSSREERAQENGEEQGEGILTGRRTAGSLRTRR
uniref:Apple domain-containing protein n=1 Tax=Chromera velia CCMP2878 TaxID=1169474 RepID=A0A0G4FVU0_9ALVE|eukprot:Cvel_469.t1-p1 / transcript=Cvel_469.t1 / gene=Cvel_469 / organism=Chromera_velia_CCMP2878 / gene_product=hypothetical protein / transcript_product=hypothetical protein / location=Cvel_scaffold15:19630-25738(-) / protein_length=598 / sequence_SO=supercontig / SO=protein_coding / is_pseudo=false